MEKTACKLEKFSTRFCAYALVMTLAIGCGGNLFENMSDDGSTEAKLESARIALDNGDYTEAIAILDKLHGANPEDNEITVDLATAYMGDAGLDAIELIRAAENAVSGSASSLEVFTDLFTFEADQAEAMHEAVDLIASIDKADITTDQSLLLAVAATADLVLTIGVNITDGFDESGQPIADIPEISEITSLIDEAGDGTETVLERINEDLKRLVRGIAGSGLVDTDLTSDINNIESDIDNDSDNKVSATELTDYLNSL